MPCHSVRVRVVVGLAASLGLASCASTTCTEAGCGPELTVNFDRTIPRDYTLDLTLDGKQGTADCTAAADPDTTAEVSVGIEGLELGVSCGPDGLTFPKGPLHLIAVLRYADGTTTRIEAEPLYEEYYPNGEDCGECIRAEREAAVNPPKGS